MTDQEFNQRSDEALSALDKALNQAADEHGFEIDMHSGALTLEFEDPRARFVVSPNSPVRQIWVSALNKSFKLDFDEARKTFVLRETGQSLTELLSSVIGHHLGEAIDL
ncbi:MAG TPA: iron donor protein CyaY [Bryobacteraceae bacterium]|jgi:CyaY protein